ncbi:hypothetical protein HYP19_gp36 [Escherichia phage ESSI2_ev239]|uniref:Uncharacterized protein n=1 Tax=Escherichia phage ESSI2_ev239 TaxID=2695847 RepID=A0A653FV00_9CAUD|nr:hypothetical protein HYP19_gp36 [Escherichia phage ESSI2_ev239]VUF53709.1 hypothetical protein [Escherichia phage ESSI2_ev239]
MSCDYVIFYVTAGAGSRKRLKTESRSWHGFTGNCTNRHN